MEGESFSGMGNGGGGGGGAGGHHQQVVDGKLIQTFHKSFVQVQSILDQNRMLISEINQNHESRAPDSLTRNVGLIRELNNNIRRVVGLYADLSASFAHRGGMDGGILRIFHSFSSFLELTLLWQKTLFSIFLSFRDLNDVQMTYKFMGIIFLKEEGV